ncbi:MAG TPA: MG2 domain-containing protein [Bacteroidia bacterium]|nr:MG2 domain-containing protein [Bacteroidia bacterium]
MSKRLLLLITALVAAVLISLTLIFKNHGNQSEERPSPAFAMYINAFTSGIISSESTIRIVLANETDKSQEFGKPIEQQLFDFSPNINGTAVWLDKRTIEFRPEKPLLSNTTYDVNFKLSALVDTPDDLKKFHFSFKTIQQAFEVFVDGMTTTDKKTFRTQRLDGSINLADIADPKQVEKIVKVSQNGKPLHISWLHESTTSSHFTVEGIQRTEKEGSVTLSWDGDAIHVDTKDDKVIPIPALGDFKVVNTKVIQSPEQYAVIQFSDPIDENQNLNGLVTLSARPSIKYIVEGNEIRVYPQERQVGNQIMSAEPGIVNVLGKALKERHVTEVIFEELKPSVELIGKGVILPNVNGLILPFKAVSLNAIDVKVLKIYEKNVPQFLQASDLNGDNELRRVGKVILKKNIPLTQKNASDYDKWNNYFLDLSELIKTEPGAIYRIMISFKKQYSTYHCNDSTSNKTSNQNLQKLNDEVDENDWDYYGSYYYEGGDVDEGDEEYDYKQRENPCHSSYYYNKTVTRNVLASDMGMIAKRGTDGSMCFVVTNLITAKPMANIAIDIYDFQQQLMRTVKTNEEGMCEVKLTKKPFLLVAKNGSQRGYLKLNDGASLSLSAFDVSGEQVQKGIKGFIYGERGVWRPGDSLFLNFILEDKQHTLPQNHPIQFELLNPQGQVYKKIIKTSSTGCFYNFTTCTDKNAPTGNWMARIKVGGVTFTKNIKIETVMPNRLKIKLDFGSTVLTAKSQQAGTLEVKWLHGAIAKNLKAKVDVTLNPITTKFKGFDKYNFDDAARNFSAEPQSIFDDHLNEEGIAKVKPNIEIKNNSAGMLSAGFKVRVFEEGGAFSTDQFSIPYSPYESYVGMQVPPGAAYTGMLETGADHIVNVATVNSDGKPVSKNKLKVQVFKIEWRWWWESYDDLGNYIGNEYRQSLQEQEISTVNGKGKFTLRINQPEWGRYYVCITDPESGHRSGQTIYMDWPSWAGSSPKGNEGAALLSFTSDKKEYNVNETVKLNIPSSGIGRALVSIENGSNVLKAYWVETKKGETPFEFKVTPEMTPNIYVNVTLIQPHSQTLNDLPIRLYGVIPISVVDASTHLTPQLVTPEKWVPETKSSLTVSEKDGKEMDYTIAIVDDGLLDLTRFNTPDPWKSLYAREALGVKTWDLFDMVMGAYSAELSRILAIGGDGDINNKSGSKANRFKPMVRFMGPYHLNKGQKATHQFMMPQYVGSVRTMVIAGYQGAYGSAEKTTPVRKPLMILGTLPRVLGPQEEVNLPVTVFAMEKHVKNVSVTIQPNSLFTPVDGTSKSVTFNDIGDETVTFKLKVNAQLGIGRVKIVATSGAEKSTYDIELDIRNSNTKVVDVLESVIEPGKAWTTPYKLTGMSGTNKGTVELSNMPPINLQDRLDYLIAYPHGCIEQTTSSVFPQLFLSDILELDKDYKSVIERNVKAGIERLKLFLTPSGGLSYWPGEQTPSGWGSNYAGHFLLEAELKGYELPPGLIESWKRYQRGQANAWVGSDHSFYYHEDLEQAYRLYTLALAKAPELGAMNRLKEYTKLSVAAKWRLAAAYAKIGQMEVAKQLVNALPTKVPSYREMDYTFGSHDRDAAMILETLSMLNMRTEGLSALRDVAHALSSDYWLSTQETAYCLIAVSKMASKVTASKEMRYQVKANNTSLANQSTTAPLKQIDMKIKGTAPGEVYIKNDGAGVLFARVILEGIPAIDKDQEEENNNLNMNVTYTTMQGKPLDISKLEQGNDFIAEVEITNPGLRGNYAQMALTQIFPSGWEIHNTRMDEVESTVQNEVTENNEEVVEDEDGNIQEVNAVYRENANDDIRYQDIRDDRVYSYFDIVGSRTIKLRIVLNAAYVGRFYLPAVYCEAMYDNTINARKPGQWVEVVKAGTK